MCLITEQKTPLIAESDIIVYKQVRNVEDNLNLVLSTNQSFPYTLKKLYETEIKPRVLQRFSYADYIVDEYYTKVYGNDYRYNQELLQLAEGFHFYRNLDRVEPIKRRNDAFYCIVKCIVPAGAIYYVDSTGLGISNKIIIDSKL